MPDIFPFQKNPYLWIDGLGILIMDLHALTHRAVVLSKICCSTQIESVTTRSMEVPEAGIGTLVMGQIVWPVAESDTEVMAIWL